MENLLIRGLTEEEQQMLKELQIKDAREEGAEIGRFVGVDALIAKGRAKDVADACEVLGVSMEDYLKWKAGRED